MRGEWGSAQPGQGNREWGGKGCRSPLPPRKLTAEHEGHHQGSRQGLETVGTAGGCCGDPLGSLKAIPCHQERNMEKRAGSGAPVAFLNPQSPRQGVLGQSNSMRPDPAPAQEHEELGDPKNPLWSIFWGHGLGRWDSRQQQHQENPSRPASLEPCLIFPTLGSSWRLLGGFSLHPPLSSSSPPQIGRGPADTTPIPAPCRGEDLPAEPRLYPRSKIT